MKILCVRACVCVYVRMIVYVCGSSPLTTSTTGSTTALCTHSTCQTTGWEVLGPPSSRMRYVKTVP